MSTIINEGGDAPEQVDIAQMDDTALDAALQGKETTEGAQDAPDINAKDEQGRPKFVPHAALHEERETRKKAEARAAELETWQRQMMARFQEAEARKAEQAAEAQRPKIPTVDEDPIGHIVGRLDEVQNLTVEQQNWARQQAEQAQWSGYVQQDRQQFVAQNPDFEAAVGHLAQNRQAMYEAMGYSPSQVQMAMAQDAQNVGLTARQTGQSPSQLLYNLARAAGYQKAPVEGAAAKLETIQRGQETTRNAGAGKAKASLDPKDLLNMSDEEFDLHFDKVMRG